MKKITFISNNIPLPEDRNGNTANIINIIRQLKKYNYSITFYLFSDNILRDAEYLDTFKNEVDCIICKKHISKYFFYLNFFRKKENPESLLFFCNFNSGFYYPIFKIKKNGSVLYAADSVSFQYYKQNGLKALLRYVKLSIEESFLYKKFNKVIFVSPLDLGFSRINNGLYIPIGYSDYNRDLCYTRYTQKKYDLVFSGNYNYAPNVDAVLFFMNSIFPSLLSKRPNIKVCFVGRYPTTEMKRYCEEYPNNIIVTGEVKSVEEYLSMSRVYLSSLQRGSGMKNKMLQAMICKLPIVCTSESITGINEYNSESVFVSDAPKDLISIILQLLSCNDTELKRLGELNYKTYKENYTWYAVVSGYYIPLFSTFS